MCMSMCMSISMAHPSADKNRSAPLRIERRKNRWRYMCIIAMDSRRRIAGGGACVWLLLTCSSLAVPDTSGIQRRFKPSLPLARTCLLVLFLLSPYVRSRKTCKK